MHCLHSNLSNDDIISALTPFFAQLLECPGELTCRLFCYDKDVMKTKYTRLAFTRPNVISASPKNVLIRRIDFTVLP